MEYLEALQREPGPLRALALEEVRSKFPPPPHGSEEELEARGQGVIRLDLRLSTSFPIDCPRELWIDHAIVQETAETHADGTLKHLEHGEPKDGPAIQKTEDAKLRKYAALMEVAGYLSRNRWLDFQPEFLFPVITSLGYMNDAMKHMMDFMASRYKLATKQAGERSDGVQTKTLKARYKREMKQSICFALARGNALAVMNQGVHGVCVSR